jgi:hypothetical protein
MLPSPFCLRIVFLRARKVWHPSGGGRPASSGHRWGSPHDDCGDDPGGAGPYWAGAGGRPSVDGGFCVRGADGGGAGLGFGGNWPIPRSVKLDPITSTGQRIEIDAVRVANGLRVAPEAPRDAVREGGVSRTGEKGFASQAQVSVQLIGQGEDLSRAAWWQTRSLCGISLCGDPHMSVFLGHSRDRLSRGAAMAKLSHSKMRGCGVGQGQSEDGEVGQSQRSTNLQGGQDHGRPPALTVRVVAKDPCVGLEQEAHVNAKGHILDP